MLNKSKYNGLYPMVETMGFTPNSHKPTLDEDGLVWNCDGRLKEIDRDNWPWSELLPRITDYEIPVFMDIPDVTNMRSDVPLWYSVSEAGHHWVSICEPIKEFGGLFVDGSYSSVDINSFPWNVILPKGVRFEDDPVELRFMAR